MPDPVGNVNNWLFVRKPETTVPPPHASQLTAQLEQQQDIQNPAAAFLSNQGNNSSVNMSSKSASPIPLPLQQSATTDVGAMSSTVAPVAAQVDEPSFTRRKFGEFLAHHTAYELIPESGKVVVLDMDLPLRQAFHALHEQGIASGPLFDSTTGKISGVISASDFIETLKRLRSLVSSSANPMSESEMDLHTIRGLREQLASEGREPRELVGVGPSDSLAYVVRTLFEKRCSMAPVLDGDAASLDTAEEDGVQVLCLATLSGIVACLMRHFRASLASLPLLAEPLSSLPIGTWSPDSKITKQDALSASSGMERRDRRKIAPIQTVTRDMLLTDAMGMLLELGVSSLPVLDEKGAVIDIFARADVTSLAKGNAYSRLQFEDVTVGQALSLADAAARPPQVLPLGGTSPSSSLSSLQDTSTGSQPPQRLWTCSPDEPLRGVLERLALSRVRRVVVAHPETKHIECIVSLSDIAAFLLLF